MKTTHLRRLSIVVCASVALSLGLGVGAQSARAPTASAATASATPSAQRSVLVMGDSLSAGYGLAASQGWVSLTAQKVSKEKPGWRVVNASISGETTAGGASRIAAELKRHKPSVVVLPLGLRQ